MSASADWADTIFSTETPFRQKNLRVLTYQLKNNPVYRTFYKTVSGHSKPLDDPLKVPLLPIRAFKYKTILAVDPPVDTAPVIFKSSGTGADIRSTHAVASPALYQRSIEEEFYKHFPAEKYAVIAFLPGYSENPHSSLIYMMKHLIGKDPLSAIVTEFDSDLIRRVEKIKASGKKWVLFGAAFGLLDQIDRGLPEFSMAPEIVETGGMKTYRREMSKNELRNTLSDAFQIRSENIHSEYGMCELLSQMYSIGGEWFTSPHWTQVTIRNADNPLELCKPGEEGKIGIIDLANIYSCPFILTEDRGVQCEDGSFQVLGRWNPGDLRGCNFLIDRD